MTLDPGWRGPSGSPVVPPGVSAHECGTAQSASRHFAASLCSSCPSPPLLPVWENVSSSSPWLLDFHRVQFSDSSVFKFVVVLLLGV